MMDKKIKTAIGDEYTIDFSKQAAGIVHEIRNPLTAVKGFLQLLIPDLTDINKKQYATIALEELDRANDLIQQFLLESRPSTCMKKSVSVNQLVKQMELMYTSEAILQNISLEVALSTEEPLVYVDENQLKQVITNLLKNAFEAVGSKGMVCISTNVVGNVAFISISDNGSGIDNPTLESLFTPFYTTKPSGTGLGLSISKKIIEDHNGKMTVCSTLGKETTFQLELPLYEENNTQTVKYNAPL
ncbi:ATP-binding protein [Bacillus sp. 31A1R]|uniref:histidine kinase n=1 Tax=Robertmurraya mangrovi TaxID=3098077 RepID=A0ABU5J051_9BACI|nr:ATP-binding protein [Bacillus sp. 31A1R]MDZ5472735.1 ATP-binding protein [Bacillus sp. 31A1R]